MVNAGMISTNGGSRPLTILRRGLAALLFLLIAIAAGGYQPALASGHAARAVGTVDAATTALFDAYDLGAQHAHSRVASARHASDDLGRERIGTAPTRLPTATVVAAEDGTTLFRGMRGAADGSPELGSTAKTLGARPGIDIPVDEGGMVRPGTGGMSVNDSPTGMPEYRRPPSFGGSGKDLNMYCISSCDIGPGLRYAPDAGGHGFLEPAWEMPFSEYQGYLQGTAGSWGEVLP
jgi:hypothetical protein